MKKLLATLILLVVPALVGATDTVTSRLSLTEPDINSANWGAKLNNNLSLIDAGVGVLGKTNTWTQTNTFSGPIVISSYTTISSSVTFSSITVSNQFIGTGTMSQTGAATLGSAATAVTISSNAIVPGATFYSGGPIVATVPVSLTGTATLTVSSNTVLSGATFYNAGPILMGAAGQRVQISSNTILPGATFYQNGTDVRLSTTAFGGSISFNAGSGVVGTTGLENPCAGCYGEFVSSKTPSGVGATSPGTGVFGDALAITFTAGDWDLSAGCLVEGIANVTKNKCGISPNPGNTTTGMNVGDNYFEFLPTTAGATTSVGIPNFRVLTNTTTTYYLKYTASFSGTAPTFDMRISARRMR